MVIWKGKVIATNEDGKILAEGMLIRPSDKQNFDAHSRIYYYRITAGKIDSASATEAHRWHKP